MTPEREPATGPVQASKQASLSIQPSWRRAGEVLERKASPSLPFAMDPREIARRESLSRWHSIYSFSTKYRISPDLARKIYDAAIREGIEPELGFRLVRVESVFNPRATSPVGALGLTQLMLGTARGFEPGISREALLDAETNLRIGFRYLRALIRENRGNLRIALLTYNRGPVAVRNAISMGIDPANGYELVVMRGYRGRGTLD
ncbi:MAG TPA: transglycosylase SLT domain-containing protein [Gemmatimonas sp.]|nr:transglycosylase SLT domain-containing protein [Gemmatimonas sp.]